MGMNSRLLSQRARQPGHDQTFRESESNFVEALEMILDPDEWRVEDHPPELRRIIGGRYGVVPEASIEYLPTGRKFFFEVKKQGPAGNADERACKHHTVQFYKELHALFGYDYHPFATIMCESLATLERYTVKHPFYFEEGHYFCWVDYDVDLLADFIAQIASRWLMDPTAEPPQALPQ
nr:Sse9I restriction endonuclease [Sporosarcina sp.]